MNNLHTRFDNWPHTTFIRPMCLTPAVFRSTVSEVKLFLTGNNLLFSTSWGLSVELLPYVLRFSVCVSRNHVNLI